MNIDVSAQLNMRSHSVLLYTARRGDATSGRRYGSSVHEPQDRGGSTEGPIRFVGNLTSLTSRCTPIEMCARIYRFSGEKVVRLDPRGCVRVKNNFIISQILSPRWNP